MSASIFFFILRKQKKKWHLSNYVNEDSWKTSHLTLSSQKNALRKIRAERNFFHPGKMHLTWAKSSLLSFSRWELLLMVEYFFLSWEDSNCRQCCGNTLLIGLPLMSQFGFDWIIRPSATTSLGEATQKTNSRLLRCQLQGENAFVHSIKLPLSSKNPLSQRFPFHFAHMYDVMILKRHKLC